MTENIKNLTEEELNFILENGLLLKKLQQSIPIIKVIDYIYKENPHSKLMATHGVRKCLDITMKEAQELVDVYQNTVITD